MFCKPFNRQAGIPPIPPEKFGNITDLYIHLIMTLTFTDNGPHCHNTAVLLYLAEVNATFNVTLLEYNNFEAGEKKTVLDTHFAHVSRKIVCWVRVGNNLDSGEQLANLLEV